MRKLTNVLTPTVSHHRIQRDRFELYACLDESRYPSFHSYSGGTWCHLQPPADCTHTQLTCVFKYAVQTSQNLVCWEDCSVILKTLVTKTGDLSSVPGTRMRGESWSLEIVLLSPHACPTPRMHTHAQSKRLSVKNIKNGLSKELMQEYCTSHIPGTITRRCAIQRTVPHTTNHSEILILYHVYFFSNFLLCFLKFCVS